jgi:hypothetical protein
VAPDRLAERELRGIALGRKSWLFAGSDRGGERAAIMLTLIHTAKLNDVESPEKCHNTCRPAISLQSITSSASRRGGHLNAKDSGRLQIDDELEFGRL